MVIKTTSNRLDAKELLQVAKANRNQLKMSKKLKNAKTLNLITSSYFKQFSLDQLAQTNINLNNLTFQMLKERQSQMSSQQPCSSNGPDGPQVAKLIVFYNKKWIGIGY